MLQQTRNIFSEYCALPLWMPWQRVQGWIDVPSETPTWIEDGERVDDVSIFTFNNIAVILKMRWTPSELGEGLDAGNFSLNQKHSASHITLPTASSAPTFWERLEREIRVGYDGMNEEWRIHNNGNISSHKIFSELEIFVRKTLPSGETCTWAFPNREEVREK